MNAGDLAANLPRYGSDCPWPTFAVSVVIILTTDPDEGANIGGGLIALLTLALSFVAAAAFLGVNIVRRLRSPADGRDDL